MKSEEYTGVNSEWYNVMKSEGYTVMSSEGYTGVNSEIYTVMNNERYTGINTEGYTALNRENPLFYRIKIIAPLHERIWRSGDKFTRILNNRAVNKMSNFKSSHL